MLVASDGPRLNAERPTVFLGARGVITFDLSIVARDGGHHSGNWGGILSDPAIQLAHAIASVMAAGADAMAAAADAPDAACAGLTLGDCLRRQPLGVAVEELAIWFPQHAKMMDAGLALHMAELGYDPVSGASTRPPVRDGEPAPLISGCGSAGCA